eukprot:TRINITY_DN6437_c0_g1_i2.p1 TRINITY_DN6437_c0_g1~~TRINITY_DN6437_c0_g1_i2.p1  ORF type:complete len:149 (-),score=32.11 TRINITY_DN6437_c0_g1_i2:355-801(-)
MSSLTSLLSSHKSNLMLILPHRNQTIGNHLKYLKNRPKITKYYEKVEKRSFSLKKNHLFCHMCGSKGLKSSNFCFNCGKKLFKGENEEKMSDFSSFSPKKSLQIDKNAAKIIGITEGKEIKDYETTDSDDFEEDIEEWNRFIEQKTPI